AVSTRRGLWVATGPPAMAPARAASVWKAVLPRERPLAGWPGSGRPGHRALSPRGTGLGPDRRSRREAEAASGAVGEGWASRRLDRSLPPRGPAVHRPADRARPDLRRSGGHRHRERAPLQGAPGEESCAERSKRAGHGVAGAADGDEREPVAPLQL